MHLIYDPLFALYSISKDDIKNITSSKIWPERCERVLPRRSDLGRKNMFEFRHTLTLLVFLSARDFLGEDFFSFAELIGLANREFRIFS